MPYEAFPSGPFETNAYVLYSLSPRHAVFIDPAPGSQRELSEFVKEYELEPKAIWLTHTHWDHFADAAALKRKYSIPVLVHEEDAGNLIEPGSDGLPCWMSIEGVNPERFFQEGETLNVGNLQAQVITTPGHTPGGVCFFLPTENLLFSGDTLFKGNIGNLSFPTARPVLMWKSLAKLAKLPPNTIVLPGHGPSTTIEKENWLDRAEEHFG